MGVPRHGETLISGTKKLGMAALIPYTAFVLSVVFWPTPVDSGARGWISTVVETLHEVGVPKAFGYDEFEFTANIGMFVPLGVFLGLVLGQVRIWWGWILLPVASTVIELVQLLFLESRVADIRDVAANSIGGWVGLLVIWLWLRACTDGQHARDSGKLRHS